MKKIVFAALAATALLSACHKPGATTTRLQSDADTLAYAIGFAQSQNPSEEQIKNYLMQAGSDSAYVAEFIKGIKEGMDKADDKKVMARELGVQYGMQMKMGLFPQIEGQVFVGDSTRHLNPRLFLAGMNDGRTDNCAISVNGQKLTVVEVQQFVGDLMGRMVDKANASKKTEAHAFMLNVAKQPGVQPLEGGVYYKVLTEGKGAVPTVEQTVKIEYEGRFADGSVFDASEPGQPVTFPVGGVVPGFATALTHMPVGSEWEVYIPYDLAYGERGQGKIPAYANLVFKIKLVSIEAAAAE